MLSAEGKLKWHLSLGIDHDIESGVSTMSQEHCIEMLLDHFNMKSCVSAPKPSNPNLLLLKSHSPEVPNVKDTKYFQQIIGRLMYASTLMRQDIAFSASVSVPGLRRTLDLPESTSWL